MKIHPVSIIVRQQDEPIFSERSTLVGIDDESGGGFITIKQTPAQGAQVISFDVEEWPYIRAAVNRMLRTAREYNADTGNGKENQ